MNVVIEFYEDADAVAGADTGLFLRPTWATLASSSALSMQSIELALAHLLVSFALRTPPKSY